MAWQGERSAHNKGNSGYLQALFQPWPACLARDLLATLTGRFHRTLTFGPPEFLGIQVLTYSACIGLGSGSYAIGAYAVNNAGWIFGTC
jgi:hypothetical protein